MATHRATAPTTSAAPATSEPPPETARESVARWAVVLAVPLLAFVVGVIALPRPSAVGTSRAGASAEDLAGIVSRVPPQPRSKINSRASLLPAMASTQARRSVASKRVSLSLASLTVISSSPMSRINCATDLPKTGRPLPIMLPLTKRPEASRPALSVFCGLLLVSSIGSI
jgi:hypothetical protein